MKKVLPLIIVILFIGSIIGVIWYGVKDIFSTPEEQIQKMSDIEKQYLNDTLGKISKDTTPEQAKEMFGDPLEEVPNKYTEWWVKADKDSKYRQQLTIYFKEGKATGFIFDGGPGEYYYQKDF